MKPDTPNTPRRVPSSGFEHDLKVWPSFFPALLDGTKPFEIRKNDRTFSVGDTLLLREWDQMSFRYSGRQCRRVVTYITDWEQKPGYVVMGLEVTRSESALRDNINVPVAQRGRAHQQGSEVGSLPAGRPQVDEVAGSTPVRDSTDTHGDKPREPSTDQPKLMISTRLQKSLIANLKAIAKIRGVKYQALIRQVLTEYIAETKPAPTAHSAGTSMVALGDLKEAEETVWACTGSAFLAGEKCDPDDRQAIYLKLCTVGNLIAAAREELSVHSASGASAADYEEVLADQRRLCRELDAILSYPDEPARQASLCDLIPFAKSIAARARRYYWLNGRDNFLVQIDDKPVRLKCGDVLDRWIDARIAEENATDATTDRNVNK